MSRLRSASAGAVAAAVWAAQEPLDRRVFGCDYSDVALLGKLVTRGPAWRAVGLGIHLVNGAIFGLAYHEVREQVPFEPRRLAVGLALAEHITLYPLGFIFDDRHPASGQAGVPRFRGAVRPFAQATWRHALFGWVLGRLS